MQGVWRVGGEHKLVPFYFVTVFVGCHCWRRAGGQSIIRSITLDVKYFKMCQIMIDIGCDTMIYCVMVPYYVS